MTIVVGVRCSDGVVLGVDSAATNTAGLMPLLRMGTDKLQVISDRVIFATTGAVGLSQRFHQILKGHYDGKLFGRQNCIPAVTTIARDMVQDMQKSFVMQQEGLGWGFGAVLAAQFNDGVELVEFSPVDFQPELKRGKLFFSSVGSGQTLADPFLSFVCRVLWQDKPPTIDIARFGIHWALRHTIQCAPGGVGEPIKLGVFGRQGHEWQCRLLDEPELQEDVEYIEAIEAHIRAYQRSVVDNADVPAPAPPEPPPPEKATV